MSWRRKYLFFPRMFWTGLALDETRPIARLGEAKPRAMAQRDYEYVIRKKKTVGRLGFRLEVRGRRQEASLGRF